MRACRYSRAMLRPCDGSAARTSSSRCAFTGSRRSPPDRRRARECAAPPSAAWAATRSPPTGPAAPGPTRSGRGAAQRDGRARRRPDRGERPTNPVSRSPRLPERPIEQVGDGQQVSAAPQVRTRASRRQPELGGMASKAGRQLGSLVPITDTGEWTPTSLPPVYDRGPGVVSASTGSPRSPLPWHRLLAGRHPPCALGGRYRAPRLSVRPGGPADCRLRHRIRRGHVALRVAQRVPSVGRSRPAGTRARGARSRREAHPRGAARRYRPRYRTGHCHLAVAGQLPLLGWPTSTARRTVLGRARPGQPPSART